MRDFKLENILYNLRAILWKFVGGLVSMQEKPDLACSLMDVNDGI